MLKILKFPTPAGVSLREAWDEHYRPAIAATVAAGTLSAYRSTLNAWERCFSGPGPPVESLTAADLERFRAGLLAAGLANATANKHWRHLRAILNHGAAADWRNPAGIGLIERRPHIRQLPEAGRRVELVTPEAVSEIYRAADAARWPLWCDAGRWWRGLLVLLWHYGPRLGDAVSRFAWPGIDRAARVVRFVPQKTEARKPAALELPLTRVVWRHLRRLPRPGLLCPPSGRFTSRRQFYREWSRLLETAGLPADPGERLTPADFRKTANSRLRAIHPDAGPYVLGHAARDVNTAHYADRFQTARRALRQLELPAAFTERDQQRRLF